MREYVVRLKYKTENERTNEKKTGFRQHFRIKCFCDSLNLCNTRPFSMASADAIVAAAISPYEFMTLYWGAVKVLIIILIFRDKMTKLRKNNNNNEWKTHTQKNEHKIAVEMMLKNVNAKVISLLLNAIKTGQQMPETKMPYISFSISSSIYTYFSALTPMNHKTN